MKRVLLLNSDWSPLNFVSSIRALNLLFKGRAEVISLGEKSSFWDESITTPTRSFDLPATLRLVERVNKKFSPPRFKKRILFNRDGWRCQYCDVELDLRSITIDHVVPRSRGGSTSWKNCVAACRKCNAKKGSRTLLEAGMHLKRPPSEPKITHFWEWESEPERHSSWHPDWSLFFKSDIYIS